MPGHSCRPLAFVALALCLAACDDEAVEFEGDVLEGLRAAGVTAVEVVPDDPEPGARYFDLWFDQPVDHAAPGGAQFRQYAALIHVDDDAPTVVYTSGYGAGRLRSRAEVTRMVGGNQLSLEYRFYATSRPEPADWSLLDVAQASADFHAIIGLVRPLYDGPWLHTGGSKGGETVLHSRYLYPDDFEASVAYVTPVRLGNPDLRYASVLDQVGDAACRTQLRAAHRAIAERRTAMVARATATGEPFEVLGVDYATEIAIVEVEWSFWQYRGIGDCARIPAATESDAVLG
nr:aminopeptidase [Deltaproteobacteria bacterium]